MASQDAGLPKEMNLERYRKQLERLTKTNTANLTPVLIAIAQQYAKYGKDARLRKKLKDLLIALRSRAFIAYTAIWELSSQVQAKLLKKQPDDTLKKIGYAAALAYAAIVVRRARAVLSNTEDPITYAPAYAETVSRVASSIASKKGFEDTGVYFGARWKEFVRIRRAKEPREHSRLEGSVIRIDDKWNIGGVLADGPGDDVLPIHERAWCGHIAVYYLSKPKG